MSLANARLIAACPKLLEALESDSTLLAQVADYLNHLGGGPMEDRLRLMQSVHKAAIEKARGGR